MKNKILPLGYRRLRSGEQIRASDLQWCQPFYIKIDENNNRIGSPLAFKSEMEICNCAGGAYRGEVVGKFGQYQSGNFFFRKLKKVVDGKQ